MPADFRVGVAAATTGVWRVKASWTGRGISGLWLIDDAGKTVLKRVSAPPLELAFEVDERWASSERELTVRFATTTDRGVLDGILEVVPPVTPDEQAEEEETEREAAAPQGVGRCLAPGFEEEATGHALELLARTLDETEGDDATRCLAWVRRIAEILRSEAHLSERRDAVDTMWRVYMADRDAGDVSDRALRALLSTVEDLLRREGLSRVPSRERHRQMEFLERLDCLPASLGGA